MTIPLPEALFLGLLQGISEILPISSDGHLALVQMLSGSEVDRATWVFFRLGTLLAIAVFLRKPSGAAWREGVRGILRPSLLKETQGGRDAVAVAQATLATGIVGLALEEASRAMAGSPTLVGSCLLGSALLMGSTYRAPQGDKDSPTPWDAIVVGVAQGGAVLPGLSRSALTLASLLWLGIRGERAFELSFLMAIPAMGGALLLDAHEGFPSGDHASSLVLGMGLAFVGAYGSLRVLRSVLARHALFAFALYLVPLGVAMLAWGYARP